MHGRLEPQGQAANGDLLITYTWQRKKIRFVRFPLKQIVP